MVTSGRHYNDGCCFDYGNAEVDNNDDKAGTGARVRVCVHCLPRSSRGAGTMEAIYFGNSSGWGHGQVCVRQWRARACCSMQRVTLLPTGAGAMGHG